MKQSAGTVRFFARRILRSLLSRMQVRGRHRLVDGIGSSLGSDLDVLDLGGLRIEIRHELSTSRMMFYGVYEPHLTNWIARSIRPGDRVIEPGANVGFISAHLRNAVGEDGLVLALEPSRQCVSALESNNELKVMRNFRLLNAAISATDGEAWFFETRRIHSHGYGCLEAVEKPLDAVRYPVTTRSVDSLMDEYGIRKLRFLKLDVEGSELPALHGASRSLSEGRIDFVMVETDLNGSDRELCRINGQVSQLLANSGFAPHRMSQSGSLKPFDIDAFGMEGRRLRTDLMWARSA